MADLKLSTSLPKDKDTSSIDLIKCLFYSEFDNQLGPQIVYQIPEGFIDTEHFQQISDYILMGNEFCHQIVSLHAFSYTILGYPISLEDKKYDRHHFIFNLCFVLPSNCITAPFENILKKLNHTLESLEIEKGILFNKDNTIHLKTMIDHIYNDLNRIGECILSVFDRHFLYLKLIPIFPSPPDVKVHKVPVMVKDLNALFSKKLDVTLHRIIPFIDGIRHIKKIAISSDTDVELVIVCVRQLLYYEMVVLIDIFQFSNIYCVTSKIGNLNRNVKMQEDCIDYILQPNVFPKPHIRLIFFLYCSLRRGEPIGSLVQRHNFSSLAIDPRRFITFGLINKLIYRVHQYPLYIQDLEKNIDIPPIYKLYDGHHSYDEICCLLDRSDVEVDALLQSDKKIVVIQH